MQKDSLSNRFGFPDLGIGIGLRTVHFNEILKTPKRIDWFEIISENFMDTEGRPLHVLDKIAERYPIVMHGVSLSIGSCDPLHKDYLKKLKQLAKRCNAHWVSDHLCWTGIAGRNTHDLLPMPYTEEALKHTVSRIKQVQEVLERPLVLENPSSYVEFVDSSLTEADFLASMAEESDCGLLLDVNNVFVSSRNHSFDPREYINKIPADRVVQYHLAGHTDLGTHILDTHVGPVPKSVWELFQYTVGKVGRRSMLLEWDEDIPKLSTVIRDAKRAKKFLAQKATAFPVPPRPLGESTLGVSQ